MSDTFIYCVLSFLTGMLIILGLIQFGDYLGRVYLPSQPPRLVCRDGRWVVIWWVFEHGKGREVVVPQEQFIAEWRKSKGEQNDPHPPSR